MEISKKDINNYFGDIDLFLLDLLLKGKVKPGRILEVGFQTGRNLVHFLQQPNYDVYGIEKDEACLALIRLMVAGFKHQNPENFVAGSATELPFSDGYFQTVICTRVFHYLNPQEKQEAWKSISRVLSPGGLLYLTVNSTVNFSESTEVTEEAFFSFPNGSNGFFLTEEYLSQMLDDPKFEKIEPVRHLQFDDQHAETILVLQKQ